MSLDHASELVVRVQRLFGRLALLQNLLGLLGILPEIGLRGLLFELLLEARGGEQRQR